MSLFLLMIYEDEAAWAAADEATYGRILEAHGAFGTKYGAKIKGGEALKPSVTAKSVRRTRVTDGPFVETKEALGGYYLVDVDSLDEAVELAKEVPAEYGGVEVREVMVFS
jgi:hypothetical protein